MARGDRGRRQEFYYKIAVRHGIDGIGSRAVEAERRGTCLAVDRERGSGQRCGAERAFVEPGQAIAEAAAVAADAAAPSRAARRWVRGVTSLVGGVVS